MTLWAVATIMAPNLFLHKAVPSRLTDGGAEKGHAEKAADIMRLLIRYQDLLWTVSGAPPGGRGGRRDAVRQWRPLGDMVSNGTGAHVRPLTRCFSDLRFPTS